MRVTYETDGRQSLSGLIEFLRTIQDERDSDEIASLQAEHTGGVATMQGFGVDYNRISITVED